MGGHSNSSKLFLKVEAKSLKNREVYEFGPFRLDPVGKVLYRQEEPVHLTRKAVETLLVLVENSPEVVPKEQILTAVWPDRVVEEANLTQNISVIRKTLGVTNGEAGYIETFAGRGYRLQGPVTRNHGMAPREGEGGQESEPRRGAKPGVIAAATAAVVGLALLLTWVTNLVLRDQTPVVGGLQPVTRLPGKEYQPAISPDGRFVAFLWARTGDASPRLFIRNLETGEQTEISSAPGHHSSPAWSPDGRRIAFLRIGPKSTEVVIAPHGGGPERILTQISPPAYGFDQRLMDWSPDGRTLVVSHEATPGLPLGLLLITVENAVRRTLTQPNLQEGSDVDPRFSPDGRLISFLRSIHRGQQELYSIPVTGGLVRAWTQDGRQVSGHDWESGGGAIYYASDKGGEFRLWRQSISGGAPQQLGLFGSFPLQFCLARGKPFAIYAELNQDRNIWEFEIASRRWTRLIASTGQDASPQYSPRGDEICFRSDRTGQERLWLSRADGTGQVPITPDGLEPSVGRWAPSGDAIVFNTPKTGELHLLERGEDGQWKLRPLGHRGVHPVFSRDGEWIYAGGTDGIIRVPVGGGRADPVLSTMGMSLEAESSGHALFFVRESLDEAIWRGDLDQGTVEKALEGLVPGCTSCWALARGGVYYLGTRPESLDKQALFYFDFAKRKSTLIEPYPEPLWPLGSGPFSLSPDGRKLLCVRLDSPSSDLNRLAISAPGKKR